MSNTGDWATDTVIALIPRFLGKPVQLRADPEHDREAAENSFHPFQLFRKAAWKSDRMSGQAHPSVQG